MRRATRYLPRRALGGSTAVSYWLVLAFVLVTGGMVPSPVIAADDAKFERLIRQLGSDKFAEREQARKKLVEIGVPALEKLQAAFQDEDPEIAHQARQCFKEIKRAAPITALIQELKSPDASTRARAARELVEHGPKAASAVPDLIKALEDKE